jgi:hypothetical protein
MELYTAMKKNKLLIHVTTWTDPMTTVIRKKPDAKEHMSFSSIYSF